MLDDDGIDDAEEKAANARPRRAVPERRPREPNDPRSSVLTPTGAFAARDAAVFINRETDATAESATDALTRLETRVRLELRALHTAAKSAKDHVAEAFRRVDAFGAGVISRDAFAESLAALGVAVSAAEAAALCRAADPEGAGETACAPPPARRALRGAARADADDADVCRGWPVTDNDFVSKKIVYPRCRSFARAPSDLDPALIDRSMFKPDADLRLDFVYGYDGVDCTAPNVRVTADPNTVVYCAAAVAVVHDAARDAQAHFRGHTRDITCLTLCDAEVTVGGRGRTPRKRCARRGSASRARTRRATSTTTTSMLTPWPPLRRPRRAARRTRRTRRTRLRVRSSPCGRAHASRGGARASRRGRARRRGRGVLPGRRDARHRGLRQQPHRAGVGLARRARRRAAPLSYAYASFEDDDAIERTRSNERSIERSIERTIGTFRRNPTIERVGRVHARARRSAPREHRVQGAPRRRVRARV